MITTLGGPERHFAGSNLAFPTTFGNGEVMAKKRVTLRERLQRCEDRLDMLESAIAVNGKIWMEWCEQVRAVPRKKSAPKTNRS